MPTATVSTRLADDEIELLESLSEDTGFDRATLLKTLLRRGMKEMRREQAIRAYRREEATLSRAAELAGLSTWDFISQMDSEDLVLHYDAEDFDTDLKALADRR